MLTAALVGYSDAMRSQWRGRAIVCLTSLSACTGVSPQGPRAAPPVEASAESAVSDADRARVERWFSAKERGHIETRPPSPRWGDRWLFVNGREVDLEAFTACVTMPGHFTLGPNSELRYGDPHVESVCCPDRTIFIDSARQACASWSMPGRCQHEEWLELMLSEDGSVLAIEAHAPACAQDSTPWSQKLEEGNSIAD